MQGFSQCLGLSEPRVHPHQPRPSLAAPPNLDEDEVSGLACPSHLVSVPGDGGIPGVNGVADLQSSDRLVSSSSLQHQDVQSNNMTGGTNVFGKDVDCPGRN